MVERRIDMAQLRFCWQDDTPDNSYYLDRKTGDVTLVNRHLLDLRELTDEIEKNRERYLYLPKLDRKIQLNDLREFAETVTDEQLKRVLDVAFESPHVLAAFKKILERHPDLLARLNETLEQNATARIQSWLQANFMPEVWETEEEDEDLDQEEQYDLEDFSV
jgi:hypothetical protein